MKAIKGDLQSLKKLQKQFTKEQVLHQKQQHEQQKQLALQEGKAPPLSPEDIKLFHQTVKGVTPLTNTNRVDRKAGVLKNTDYYRAKREQAEGNSTPILPKRTRTATTTPIPKQHAMLNDDSHYFLSTGMGKDVIKKLKQLVWPIEATLDLHGSNLEQATQRFDSFVHTCFEHNVKCFMIIHGKGYGSKEGETVLKPRVISWLKDLDKVAAFVTAPDNLGGDGALLILCKN
ncbi:DNA mismatch repair protein MutS [Pelistega indica]|uniref:DNA mismatch repair protein MutS n=1 Tax=Pelistega indica TaxID=1414851 RepID=V8G3P2_9BURK|nr:MULTISPECIES: Smr/MutS family protein [Pelistega]ETD71149.1 DNA mismatch repair protein MutS [Pelistega indica]